MGLAIEQEHFTAEEGVLFAERLQENLAALRELLARPGFGEGELSLGAEVELHLVDSASAPVAKNQELLDSANDPRLTLEINRFNVEINASPVALRGHSFTTLREDLRTALDVVRAAAAQHGARAVMVGTLPTLRVAHLAEGVLSDAPRYRVLSRTLREIRGEPFAVHIKGRESLSAHCDDVALEGVNASFQVHLRVPPHQLARAFNAAQLTSAPLLAATGNSPFFDGKSLWDETRLALFQQSVDTRLDARERKRLPSRVAFGYGWVQDAYALFAENVALHPVLLPVCSQEDARAVLQGGGVPELGELRLHHGTVWSWNRAVYDPAAGGHFRIEHRLLPSGPTLIDMTANAALAIGLTLAFKDRMEAIEQTFPFAAAEQNLTLAAKHGLTAELSWPGSDRPRVASELLLELLPLAEAALLDAGVDADDTSALLGIIRERVQTGRTGSTVQRELTSFFEASDHRDVALTRMLEHYLEQSWLDVPVHRWPMPR